MERLQRIDFPVGDHVSEETKLEAAHAIVAILERVAEGPYDDPQTWEDVARRWNLGVLTPYLPGWDRGQSTPRTFPDAGLVGGSVTINTAYSAVEQAEAWVHELSHLLVAAWVPSHLTDDADGYHYAGDDKDAVGHEIARMVEGLLIKRCA